MCGWNYLSIPKLHWASDYLSMLGFKLNHLSKRGHRRLNASRQVGDEQIEKDTYDSEQYRWFGFSGHPFELGPRQHPGGAGNRPSLDRQPFGCMEIDATLGWPWQARSCPGARSNIWCILSQNIWKMITVLSCFMWFRFVLSFYLYPYHSWLLLHWH